MPNIWDADLIDSNLAVLANLTTSGEGKKLNINSNGTLSIHLPSQGTRWSMPSVTDLVKFQEPLTRLFQEAIVQRNTDLNPVQVAYQGLVSLRGTYAKDQTKLKALNGLLDQINHGLLYLCSCGQLLRLHAKYGQYSRFPFAQAHFFNNDKPGICMAMTYYWVKRHRSEPNWHFTAREAIRLRTAVEKAQPIYEGFSRQRLSGRLVSLDKSINSKSAEAELAPLKLNGDLEDYLSSKLDGSQKLVKSQATGAAVFESILAECKKMEGTNFFATYEGDNPHISGLDIGNNRIDFFDSNFGEMSFDSGQKTLALSFFTDFWKECKPPGAESWDLVGYK